MYVGFSDSSNSRDSFEIDSFNTKYENDAGKRSGFFIVRTLDDIVTNNKTNKSHVITVVYNGITTTEEKEIKEIRNKLSDRKDYDVSLDYDSNGYVNKYTIEDIEVSKKEIEMDANVDIQIPNVSVIADASKEIDIEKIKKYIENMNSDSEEHKKRISIELPEEHEEQIKEKVEKDYDINSVLERARGKRETDYEIERHRKLNSNGYDILKSIQIREESDEDKTEPIDELNTQEKTIVELIQNIQNNKSQEKSTKDDTEDLFGELMGKNENTIVMAPIDNEEKNNENIKEALLNITEDLETIKESINDKIVSDTVDGQKINDELDSLNNSDKNENENKDADSDGSESEKIVADKSFYTNSLSFNKTDFEGFEDLEKNQKKGNVFAKIVVTLIILLLLANSIALSIRGCFSGDASVSNIQYTL